MLGAWCRVLRPVPGVPVVALAKAGAACANPVDILTRVMTDASELPPARVLATGMMLDTVRLRQVLARELKWIRIW